MDIDETIYKTLAPTNLKKLVSEVQPISLPISRSVNKLDLGSVVSSGCIVLSLVLIVVLGIEPRIKILRDARSALCGGDTDFVVTYQVSSPDSFIPRCA